MNTAMKPVLFLSRAATFGVLALALGVSLDLGAIVLFALAASVLVLLIGVADYAPRRDYACLAAIPVRARESIPLAA
jgi:hypothetical protein